ncbi:DNA topoisomerase, partial [Mycobacterium sp. ITM-2017-0098]
RGYFRAGGEQSAEEFEHYGLATLLCDHVTVRSGAVVFDYPAKGGVQRYIEIDDPEVVRTVRALVRQDGRPDRLLVCRNSSGDDW